MCRYQVAIFQMQDKPRYNSIPNASLTKTGLWKTARQQQGGGSHNMGLAVPEIISTNR